MIWFGVRIEVQLDECQNRPVLNHLVDAWAEKEKKEQFHPTFDYNNSDGSFSNLDYSQFDSIEKEIHTGDFYIFNGQFLHAVTAYKSNI